MDNYNKAFTEIYEIFSYMPKRAINLIPEEVLKAIKSNRDLDYKFEIDPSKSFKEQKLLKETYFLLAVIYRDYWASDARVKMIRVKENYKLNKEMKASQEKYNPDNLFKKEG